MLIAVRLAAGATAFDSSFSGSWRGLYPHAHDGDIGERDRRDVTSSASRILARPRAGWLARASKVARRRGPSSGNESGKNDERAR